MKKLMIAAAIVCAAVVSQAATAVTWNTGTGVMDVAGKAFVNGAQADYLCTIAFSTAADMSTTFAAGGTLSGNTYKTKGSSGFNGSTASTFDAGTYYAQLTIEYTDGRKYTSDIGSFSIAAGQAGAQVLNFSTGTGFTPVQSYIGDTSYTNVPEPTSAMLVLLGVAGLALKRRRA